MRSRLPKPHDSAAAGTPARQTTVQKLARQFAAEWCRPDAPEHATQTLVDTLSTAMLAFHAVARGVEQRAVPTPPSTLTPLERAWFAIRAGAPNSDLLQALVKALENSPVSGEGTGTLTRKVTRLITETANGVGISRSIVGVWDVTSMTSERLAELRQRHEREFVYARDFDALAAEAVAKDAQLAELREIKKLAKCLRLEHLIDGEDIAKRSETIHALQTYEAVAALQIENKKLESTLADLRRQVEKWPAQLKRAEVCEVCAPMNQAKHAGLCDSKCAAKWLQRKVDALCGRPLPDPPKEGQ